MFYRLSKLRFIKADVMLRFVLLVSLVLCPAIASYGDETWPGFRGRGDGVARAKNLPITWEQRGRAGWANSRVEASYSAGLEVYRDSRKPVRHADSAAAAAKAT